MTDKLDVLWSAVKRNMAMSVADEGEGENSVTCRPHQVLSMMNNVPSVRSSEAVVTVQPRRRVRRLDSETEVDLGPPARSKSVVSRGDQEKNCGSADRSVEGNDAPTVFDDTSRSRVATKQSRVEKCNSRIAGRSAMAPSKNSSSIDRRSRNRGEHRTGEFPNSSFRGVDSGRVRYHRTVDRPDRDEDRRSPVDSRGVQKENSRCVSKRRGDREGSSNKRSHSHRRRSHSYERHRCDSCRPQRGDSRRPDDPSGGGGDNSDDDHSWPSDDSSSGEDDDVRVSRVPRSRIKLQSFDGSESWESWWAHFQNSASYNCWSERDKLAFMKGALT